MNGKEAFEDYGINIGGRGEPLRPVIDAFRKTHGVGISKSSVVGLRNETFSGSKIIQQIEGRRLFLDNNASIKDTAYINVLQRALDLRFFQKTEPDRYQNKGYAALIVESTGLNQHTFGHLMQALRADILLTEEEEPDEVNVNQFQRSADLYFSHFTKRESRNPASALVKKNWSNRDSIRSFYDAYALGNIRELPSFLPYELEFFLDHFEGRRKTGSELTLLDSMTLVGAFNTDILDDDIAREVAAKSGLAFFRGTLSFHRTSLIHGLKLSPQPTLTSKS